MKLRPFQKEAVEAIYKDWDDGHQALLLVFATGLGKTITFAKIAEREVQDFKRVLILAHRAELLHQASDKIMQATGLSTALEKAEHSAIGSNDGIVVGSIQTMQGDRLTDWPRDAFDLIIIDEAHRSVTESYTNIFEHFHKARLLGVTATPDRADFRDLGEVYDKISFEFGIKAGVDAGFLVPIKAKTLPLKIDITSAENTNGWDIDLLGTALDPYLSEIGEMIIEHCKGRKTLIFLPLIKTSQKMQAILKSKGLKVGEVNGESPDRKQILKDFESGVYDILCNSMLLTEGYDCPSISCIICLRPTKSRLLYSQIVGRGTRLCDGKDDLLILDFLWHSNTHSLTRPAHLIPGSTPEVIEIQVDQMTSTYQEQDIFEAADAANDSFMEKRENSIADKLAKLRKKKGKLIDPVLFENLIKVPELSKYEAAFKWEHEKPTQATQDAIEKFGVLCHDMNAGKAESVLDVLKKRSSAGCSTPKQIKQLEQRGFNKVRDWTFDQCTSMMMRVKANGWRTPYNIKPKEYKP